MGGPEDLAKLFAGGDLRVSQLVIVKGRSNLGKDLFCNVVDAYYFMTAFLKSDRDAIRNDIDDTCGKEMFNRTVVAYIEAAADHHGRMVRKPGPHRC